MAARTSRLVAAACTIMWAACVLHADTAAVTASGVGRAVRSSLHDVRGGLQQQAAKSGLASRRMRQVSVPAVSTAHWWTGVRICKHIVAQRC